MNKSKEEYYQDAFREESRIFREKMQLVLFGFCIGLCVGAFMLYLVVSL